MADNWLRVKGPKQIGRKKVDFTLLVDHRTTIPLDLLPRFLKNTSGSLPKGDKFGVKLIFQEKEYDATLRNIDRENYAAPLYSLQFKKDLQDKLRETFQNSYSSIRRQREIRSPFGGNRNFGAATNPEFLDFYETNKPLCFRLEASAIGLHSTVILGIKEQKIDEFLFEQSLELSKKEFNKWIETVTGEGSVDSREGLVRVRIHQRSIIQRLKELYDGKCQICGWSSIDDFGKDISEGHHIEPFSVTMNNHPTNIAILCPTHHRLVHAIGATLLKDKRAFIGKNGKELPLKIDQHLL